MTREPGATTRNQMFPYGADFEIVVEVEAGHTIFSMEPHYETGIVVRDLTDNTIVPTTPAGYGPATLGEIDWDSQTSQFVYQVSSGELGPGKKNHCCEVIAFLKTGVVDPSISFANSPLFIIV
jgi:hypothetical protein